jgi:hypothetical protein
MEEKKKSCQVQTLTARKQFIDSSLKLLKTLTFWIRVFFVFSIEGEFK